MAKKKTSAAKPSYHHKALRQALLDAVLQLVKENGVAGFTLREAAKRVGVSHSAPYRHFSSREQLLAMLATEGHRELVQALRLALEGCSNSRERLIAMAEEYVHFAMHRTPLFQVMFSSEHSSEEFPELATAQGETMSFLMEEIATGQKSGAIRQSVRDHALAGWSAIHGLSILLINRLLQGSQISGQRSQNELARAVILSILDGLGPRTGTK